MKRAKKLLAPIQLGLDVKGGPACKAAAARTAHHEGYIALTGDIRNAFNEVKREKMLQAVRRLAPEVFAVYLAYYTSASVALFAYTDGDKRHVLALPSDEGTRIGCVLGSVSYDMAVEVVYKTLQAEYPDWVFRALTDDLTPLIPPPDDAGGGQAWQHLYARIVQYRHRLTELMTSVSRFTLASTSAFFQSALLLRESAATACLYLTPTMTLLLRASPLGPTTSCAHMLCPRSSRPCAALSPCRSWHSFTRSCASGY